MKPNNEFSSKDLEPLCGIKFNNVRQMIDKGYIKPSIRQSTQTGISHIFSKKDIYKIFIFKHLSDMGIHQNIASKISHSGKYNSPYFALLIDWASTKDIVDLLISNLKENR